MNVSVIITVYNEEKYIEKCLDSLQVQTFKDFEMVVIDDGSTDDTLKILNEYQISNIKYRVFQQKHEGPAKARNFGVAKAKGEVLVFLDGDMYFEKNFLEKLVNPILKGKAKGTYSVEEYVANWNNVWARCWNYNWGLPDRKRIDPNDKNQKKDFRAILKKEFDKVRGFDNIGYIDTWSLFDKLGYGPTATGAKYYHYNPATLWEVFVQAKWTAKRPYKLGVIGDAATLFRANPLFALLKGLYKAVEKKEPMFIVFKIVFDFATTMGILTKNKKYA